MTTTSKTNQQQRSYVLDTRNSPHAKLTPVPIEAVTLHDGFWGPRVRANRDRGLPRLFDHLRDHGVIENFRIVSGRSNAERRGPLFTDSDLYKWMEGAAWALATDNLPELRSDLEETIDEVIAAQGDDGYLNTFFQGELFGERFRNLPVEHELYCAGHYFEAAVAHHRATGETRLLESACRFADYLHSVFGPGKQEGRAGHPEIELALYKLYRETGEKRYADLGKVLMDRQNLPEREQIVGHAVRALYTMAAATDVVMETGDEDYIKAVDHLWWDTFHRKAYVTAGLGSTRHSEAFEDPYVLPNHHAYAETCAAIGGVFWNLREVQRRAEARFADWMEIGLYNGFLAGVGLEGIDYFYVNPLECHGNYQRSEWFGCTCCPTNAVRLFAQLPGYFYSTSDEGLWVHLYDASTVDITLPNRAPVKVTVDTRYPHDGDVNLTVDPGAETDFTLHLRIPAWCTAPSVRVNGQATETAPEPGTYLALQRRWKAGDQVELSLPMHADLLESDPRIADNRHALALRRGPLVYCLESADNPEVDILEVEIPDEVEFRETAVTDLGGVVALDFSAVERPLPSDDTPLYVPAGTRADTPSRAVDVRAIPYYAWANRGESAMRVWVPREA